MAAAQPGEKLWEFQTGGDVYSSPAIGPNGTVYVGSYDRKVYALDGATGQKRWEFLTGDGVRSSPAVGADGTVYVGSDDEELYALDGTTGQKRWEFQTGGDVYSSPAIGADGIVFVGSWDHKVYALDGGTGQKRWEFNAGDVVRSSPAIGADGTVYVGSDDMNVYALDGATGKPRWVFAALGGAYCSPAVGADGMVYVGLQTGVYALDGATGAERWAFRANWAEQGRPAIGADGTVYVGCGWGMLAGSAVYALDGTTGAKRWEFAIEKGGGISAAVISEDGTVYVGSMDKTLYALDGATGAKRWEFAAGGFLYASPAMGPGGTLYVGCQNGKVYALYTGSTLANAPWPMFGRNPRHTASAEFAGPPTLLHGPVATEALPGGTVRLGVSVGGTLPLSYQWFQDGVALEDGDRIAGGHAPLLEIGDLQEADVGRYSVVIANAEGSITSLTAQVSMRGLRAGDLRWSFQTGKPVASSPALGTNGTVYVGSDDKSIYALNGATGTKVWELRTGGPVRCSPAIAGDGTVYVGSDRFYALNGLTGVKSWEFAPGGPVSASPAIGRDGAVYVGIGVFFYALDGMTRAVLWKRGFTENYEDPILPALSVSLGRDGTVYAVTVNSTDAYATRALDWATGILRRSFWSGSWSSAAPAFGPDGAVVAASERGIVCYADALGGVKRWEGSADVGLTGSPAVAADSSVYAGTATGVLAMDLATGARRWKFTTGGGIAGRTTAPALAADGTVFVGASDKRFYALVGATGALRWEFATGGAIRSSPVIGTDGTVCFGSDDGKVYALYGDSPLADAPWPMIGGNPRHTGSAEPADELGHRPSVIWEPEDATVVVRANVAFAVTATGTAPLAYSWRKDEAPLVEGGRVAGVNTARLSLTTVVASDAGRYDVVVTNLFGSVTSRRAVLTVSDQRPGQELWRFQTGGGVTSPALGADGTVYVGSRDKKVYAVDGVMGQERWEFLTGGWPTSPALGADGTVYVVSSENRKLYAVNGATGQKRWEFQAGSAAFSSPAIGADGTIYVGSSDKKVYALDGVTGQKRWEFQTGSAAFSSPALGADGTVYVGSGDQKVYALDGDTGQKRWEFQTGGTVHSSLAIGAEGTVYVASEAGKVYALNGATGQRVWESHTVGGIYSDSLAIGADGTVYVGTGAHLYALDWASGQKRWAFSTGGEVSRSPAIGADGTVYVASGWSVFDPRDCYPPDHCVPRLTVHAVDSATGREVWSWKRDIDPSWDSSPTIGVDGTVYVGSGDGNLYALTSSSVGGLAVSPWPKFRGDAQNTGRVSPPAPLVLAISWQETGARIQWAGNAILQASDMLVPGAWQDLHQAVSPFVVEPASAQRFYRLRRPRRSRSDMTGSGRRTASWCAAVLGRFSAVATVPDPDAPQPWAQAAAGPRGTHVLESHNPQ